MPQSSYYKNAQPGDSLLRARRAYLFPNIVSGIGIFCFAISVCASIGTLVLRSYHVLTDSQQSHTQFTPSVRMSLQTSQCLMALLPRLAHRTPRSTARLVQHQQALRTRETVHDFLKHLKTAHLTGYHLYITSFIKLYSRKDVDLINHQFSTRPWLRMTA